MISFPISLLLFMFLGVFLIGTGSGYILGCYLNGAYDDLKKGETHV